MRYHPDMAADQPVMRRADRKRIELAEEMRAEIAAAAFAEFAERGYHQTAVADIAARVGVSSGTFYNYFKSKREILDHVVDAHLARAFGVLTADNAPDTPTTIEEYSAQAMRIAAALDEIFNEDPRVVRMLLFESTSIDPELTERILGLYDLAGQLVYGYLENGVRRGFFRADLDTHATAEALVGMVIATAVRSLRSSLDAGRRRTLHEAALRLILDGVRAAGSGDRGEHGASS